ARALAAVGAVAAVTLVYARWLHLSNAATASTTFLLIVLVVAATSRLWVPAVTSIAAMFAFNYFFLPPVGGLTIADPQNWVAMVVAGRTVRLVPLRVGTKPVGLLAAAGRDIPPGTLDALGGVAAIAIERVQLLDARQAGELMRRSDELKTALLASLGHDLRTPLTAIRIAATNIQGLSLSEDGRREQTELILAEVERLTRLFQSILEMARIDAGAVAADTRWAHPSEILAAARDQVEHTLRGHVLRVTTDPDEPVRLDPRLPAAAPAQA